MIDGDDELKAFYTDLGPISSPLESQLNDWTTLIRSKDADAKSDGLARYILKDFVLRQLLGKEQSQATLNWLAESLSEILEHRDPLEALGLLPRANKRPANPQAGMDMAHWVANAQSRGYSRAEAVKLAADVFHTDDSNVRRLIKAGNDWANLESEVMEGYFERLKRPLPPVKTGKK